MGDRAFELTACVRGAKEKAGEKNNAAFYSVDHSAKQKVAWTQRNDVLPEPEQKPSLRFDWVRGRSSPEAC